MLGLYVGANLVIVAGYAVAAFGSVRVLRASGIGQRVTLASAVAFFVLCATTHADLAYHAIYNHPIDRAEMTSWHQVGHMVPQAASIWIVLFGAVMFVRHAKDTKPPTAELVARTERVLMVAVVMAVASVAFLVAVVAAAPGGTVAP